MTEHLTKDEFVSKVFDYEKNAEWKFEGTMPTIIDFWAEWCGPCKMISPVLDEIAKEYNGKLNVYKVNVDEETDVASVFGSSETVNSLLRSVIKALPKNAKT